MKRNTFNSIAIIIGFMALVSCSSKKVLVSRKTDTAAVAAVKADNSITEKLNAIRSRQSTYNTFNGKAKAKLNIDGKTNDAQITLRIQHGKKIWLSLGAPIIGIEIARALITPDSIMVINKAQGVYIKKPFSYIYTYTSRQVNFNTVEALLVGNAIPETLNPKAEIQTTGTNTTISGELQNLIYRLLIGADLKVSQTNLSDGSAGQSLQVNNATFIQADNRVMPSEVNISSSVKNKKIEVNLNYSRANFDQTLEYPFSIPASYEPAN